MAGQKALVWRNFLNRLRLLSNPSSGAEGQPLTVYLSSPLVKKNSFIHRHAGMRPKADGSLGVFATGPIRKHEIVCIFVGDVLTGAALGRLSPDMQRKTLQLGEDIYLAATNPEGEPEMDEADYFNHSCDPNLYLSGNNVLIAAHNIKPGEELCYDYGTSDIAGNPDTGGDWICQCGSGGCRGRNDPDAYRHLVPKYGSDCVAHYVARKWHKEHGV